MTSIAVAVGVLLAPAFSNAQALDDDAGRKSLVAVRTATPPLIDGRLDDAAWAAAPPDDRFIQSWPDEAKAPTERTEVRILYDDRAVYVGVRLHDRSPADIVSRLTRRDRSVETDWVQIGLDSRHDHNTASFFRLSAAGVQGDSLRFDDTDETETWDAVWDGEVSRDAGGWSAELRIPLTALRFSDRDVQTWGFHAIRYISRRKETAVWNYWPRTERGGVSRFGHLTGLAGLRPARAFELRPFVVGRLVGRSASRHAFLAFGDRATGDPQGDAGLDLKLGVTSNLTLDATVNPDFGQVEADEVVLNLSRFETFFPEKRPFFLEGVEVFQTPIAVFYSRRIGRPPTGASADDSLTADDGTPRTVLDAPASLRIWTAAKLTGRVSKLTVGAVEAVTAAERADVVDAAGTRETLRLAPSRNYAVLRGRLSLGGASYLGAMATAVNRLGGALYRAPANHDAYTEGMDGQWQSRDGRWRLTGHGVVSQRVGGTGHATAAGRPCLDPAADPTCVPIVRTDGTRLGPGDVGFGSSLQANWQGDHWGAGAAYAAISPTFDANDLGFVPDFNKHDATAAIRYRETKPRGPFLAWDAAMNGHLKTDFDGVMLEGQLGWGAFAHHRSHFVQGINGGFSLPGQWHIHETGDGARFDRPNGAILTTWFATDSRKPLVFSANVGGFGDFYAGGWGAWSGGGVELKVVPQLELGLSASVSWDGNAVRFSSCRDPAGGSCTVETLDRHYLFADLDSGSLSFTARGIYTFSPRLSLQAYGQLFMSRGAYGPYHQVDTVGPRPFIRRSDLRPSPFDGDSDGDGKQDDDFQSTALNVNTVLRWEWAPGSTLMAVYTRAQSATPSLDGAAPRFRPGGLSTGPAEDVLLLKLTYFWG